MTLTEKQINKALTETEWMNSEFTFLTCPTFQVTKGNYLILSTDRKSVFVYGKISQRISSRMISQGKLSGVQSDPDLCGRVTIHL